MTSPAQHERSLDALLEGMGAVTAIDPIEIAGLSMDSRDLQAGDLFLACKGLSGHGLDFLPQVIDSGAAAVAYESSVDCYPDPAIPMVPVTDLGAKAGRIADRFYQSPSHRVSVIAVTGTNGKTSVSHYVAEALDHLYGQCGLLGTLGYGVYGQMASASHTTPDVVTVHRMMAEFVDAECDYAVMEVSSHALDQGRVDAMQFAVAVFTNLSRDHLDYHGDMPTYAAVKRRLFDWDGLQAAVINADDPVGREWLRTLPESVSPMAYSMKGPVQGVATVSAGQVTYSLSGMQLDLLTPAGASTLSTGLLGQFNAENILAALAVLLQLGVDLDTAVGLLEKVSPVAGRMQRLGGDQDPLIVVDYAHTPDALEQVLKAVRRHSRGKLFCVFGCGGDRDQGKRPLMGEVAERYADRLIITDDNPRREDPAIITQQILAGLDKRSNADVIHDREKAIHAALIAATVDDVVLIAGKGHESGQIIKDAVIPFDDTEVVSRWLEQLS